MQQGPRLAQGGPRVEGGHKVWALPMDVRDRTWPFWGPCLGGADEILVGHYVMRGSSPGAMGSPRGPIQICGRSLKQRPEGRVSGILQKLGPWKGVGITVRGNNMCEVAAEGGARTLALRAEGQRGGMTEFRKDRQDLVTSLVPCEDTGSSTPFLW